MLDEAMEFDDILSSELESTTDDPSQAGKKGKPKKRIPKCTRCQNHGKKVAVKFHKRDCEHRFCLCEMCILTTQRQHITKVQTAKRRERHRHEMLMKMRKMQKAKQGKDSEAPLTPTTVNGINDSNSSDLPSLGNHTSDILPGLSNHSSNSESCRTITEQPVVSVPMPQNLPSLLPHTTSPSAPLFDTESNLQQVELLLGCSAGLVQRFNYPWESLSLMYVILKNSRADPEVAIRSITKANNEIQATAQFKARLGGAPYYGYSRYTGSLNSLGNPTYFGQVPYVGITSPQAASGLGGLFPHALGSHAIASKVPSSPDSPPERPSSYPETSMSHHFKIEKAENTD